MTLYLLEWDNGLDFDDHEVTLLGVYTSEGKAKEARERHKANWGVWPMTRREGFFVDTEVEADTDWFLRRADGTGAESRR